jgi:hypothetical protein
MEDERDAECRTHARDDNCTHNLVGNTKRKETVDWIHLAQETDHRVTKPSILRCPVLFFNPSSQIPG